MESMQSRFRVKVLQPDIPDYAILILELLSTKLSDFHRILGSCSHLFLLSFVGTTFLKFVFKVSKKTFHCYSKWNLPYLDCPCHKVVTTCDLIRLWVTPTLVWSDGVFSFWDKQDCRRWSRITTKKIWQWYWLDSLANFASNKLQLQQIFILLVLQNWKKNTSRSEVNNCKFRYGNCLLGAIRKQNEYMTTNQNILKLLTCRTCNRFTYRNSCRSMQSRMRSQKRRCRHMSQFQSCNRICHWHRRGFGRSIKNGEATNASRIRN